jgi:hypothetical protein
LINDKYFAIIIKTHKLNYDKKAIFMRCYSTIVLRLAIFIAGAIVLAICGGAAWLAIKTGPSSE